MEARITLTPEYRQFYISLDNVGKKEFETYLTFKEKAVLYLPAAKKALPVKNAPDIDVTQPPWSWWIVLDDTTEISCMKSNTHHQRDPAVFRIIDAPNGRYERVSFELQLSEAEANALFANIGGLLSGSNFMDTATEIDRSKVWLNAGRGTFKLSNNAITYIVHSYAFQYPSNLKSHKTVNKTSWIFTPNNKRTTRKIRKA